MLLLRSLLVLVAFLSASTAAFVVHPHKKTFSTLLNVVEPLGETERILMENAEKQASGVIQRYGKTVMNDGFDGVRAAVWGIFHASNVFFPVLGAALGVGLLLNMMGYGYYFDAAGSFVIDSLQNIQLEERLQLEATKLAAAAADKTIL